MWRGCARSRASIPSGVEFLVLLINPHLGDFYYLGTENISLPIPVWAM
jgi:hypothetical protein